MWDCSATASGLHAVPGTDPSLGAGAPAQVPATGIHVGIDCNDLSGLCAILEREGIALPRPLRQAADGISLRAWIRDPDGHEIELAERH